MVVDEPGGAFGSQRGSSTANSQPPSGTLRREIVPRWCSAALGNGEAESGARGWPERDRHLEEPIERRVELVVVDLRPMIAHGEHDCVAADPHVQVDLFGGVALAP
jgi:hypothetical protein